MNTLEALKVTEIQNAAGVYLGTDAETRGKVVSCNLTSVPRPRELDDYHLSGVYGKANVPVEIEEIHFDESGHTFETHPYQALTKSVSDSVYSGLKAGKGVFVTGGTCLHAPGVAGGIRRAFGKDAKLGIIWMDAHGDINTPETSPSGMLGGMPYAAVLGLCMEDWRKICGLEPPFDDRFAILTDARNLDKEETDNLKNMNLTVINTGDFLDEQKWVRQVRELADKVDALYLHIDADIVDSQYVPGHMTPEPGGPDIWPLLRNIRVVMETGKVPVVTIASVYFNTGESNPEIRRESAILTGIRMTGTVLENWKRHPDSRASAAHSEKDPAYQYAVRK